MLKVLRCDTSTSYRLSCALPGTMLNYLLRKTPCTSRYS